jgi:hypothetical protein
MKKTMMFRFCLVLLCLVSPAGFAKVLAIWDFGPSSAFYTTEPASWALSAKPALVLTGGDIDANGKNGADFIDADGVFHVAGQGAAWDDINKSGSDNDAACTITLNTTGWQVQGLRWDYKSEKATSYDIDYRLSQTATWIQLLDNQPIMADDLFHAVTTTCPRFLRWCPTSRSCRSSSAILTRGPAMTNLPSITFSSPESPNRPPWRC